MGQLCRNGLHDWLHYRLYCSRISCRSIWQEAGHASVLRFLVADDPRIVLPDEGPDVVIATRLRKRDLLERPIYLDAGVATRIVSDADASYGARFRVQRPPIHRVSRRARGRVDDCGLRRFRKSCGDPVLDLYCWDRGRADVA